jgi:hypothetical protein
MKSTTTVRTKFALPASLLAGCMAMAVSTVALGQAGQHQQTQPGTQPGYPSTGDRIGQLLGQQDEQTFEGKLVPLFTALQGESATGTREFQQRQDTQPGISTQPRTGPEPRISAQPGFGTQPDTQRDTQTGVGTQQRRIDPGTQPTTGTEPGSGIQPGTTPPRTGVQPGVGTQQQRDTQTGIGTQQQRDTQTGIGTQQQRDTQTGIGTQQQRDTQTGIGTQQQRDTQYGTQQPGVGTRPGIGTQRDTDTQWQQDRTVGMSSQVTQPLALIVSSRDQRGMGAQQQTTLPGTGRVSTPDRTTGDTADTQQRPQYGAGMAQDGEIYILVFDPADHESRSAYMQAQSIARETGGLVGTPTIGATEGTTTPAADRQPVRDQLDRSLHRATDGEQVRVTGRVINHGGIRAIAVRQVERKHEHETSPSASPTPRY